MPPRRGDVGIVCRECGARFMFLPPHLHRTHDISAEEYRARHQIPAGVPLASAAYVERARQRATRQWQEQGPTFDQRDGVEAARQAGRGERTPADLRRQRRIMRENAPAVEFRDAEHTRKRLYLRAWRALQAGDSSLMEEYRRQRERAR